MSRPEDVSPRGGPAHLAKQTLDFLSSKSQSAINEFEMMRLQKRHISFLRADWAWGPRGSMQMSEQKPAFENKDADKRGWEKWEHKRVD